MIDWAKIDTVLLDMDGTLLDLHFDNHFWMDYIPRRYASIHQCEESYAKEQLINRFESERGTLNWYCLDYWSEQLALDVPALKREIQHLIAIRPYVSEFLQQLKDGPQHVMLVTNAHRHSLEIKLDQTGIADFFDEIVVSHDFRAPKEQVKFWQQLKSTHPFNPARSLLIDDTPSVLKSAQQFGIKYLLTMLQPDSKQAARNHTDFPGILHFDEIMPASVKPLA